MARNLANVDLAFRGREIKSVILRDTRKDKNIIHGAQALNAQLRIPTRRITRDFDIYTRKSPRAEARELERKLDTKFRADLFGVKKAIHPGTHRVMHRATGESVADYTRMPKPRPETRKINRVHYVSINELERSSRCVLKDPKAGYRHHKERETLNIIEANRRLGIIFSRRR